MKSFLTILLLALLAAASHVQAEPPLKKNVKHNRLAGNLDGVSTADIPLKVLAAINAAPVEQRVAVLTEWIEAVVAVRSTALASVLATVVTEHPELLSHAVRAAIRASPAQINHIVYTISRIPGVKLKDVIVIAETVAPNNWSYEPPPHGNPYDYSQP